MMMMMMKTVVLPDRVRQRRERCTWVGRTARLGFEADRWAGRDTDWRSLVRREVTDWWCWILFLFSLTSKRVFCFVHFWTGFIVYWCVLRCPPDPFSFLTLAQQKQLLLRSRETLGVPLRRTEMSWSRGSVTVSTCMFIHEGQSRARRREQCKNKWAKRGKLAFY